MVLWGAAQGLTLAGYEPRVLQQVTAPSKFTRIVLTTAGEMQDAGSLERYRLLREADGSHRVAGAGDAGTLYGALELTPRNVGLSPGRM